MNTTEIAIMSVFAALVVLALLLGLRQMRQQRAQMQEFAAARGWSYIRFDNQLVARLQSMDAATVWTAEDIAQFGDTWLFGASSQARVTTSKPSYGTACLVERSAPDITAPVMVTRRVPLIEKLLPWRVAELGSDEFRRGYVTACSDPEVARRALTSEVQRALVEHDSGPAWVLTVTLSASGVVVQSTWAKTPEEWDYLVRLTTRLSQAN